MQRQLNRIPKGNIVLILTLYFIITVANSVYPSTLTVLKYLDTNFTSISTTGSEVVSGRNLAERWYYVHVFLLN